MARIERWWRALWEWEAERKKTVDNGSIHACRRAKGKAGWLDGWMGGWLPAHATPPIPTPTRSRFMKQAVLGAERAATGVAVYRGVSRGAIALAPRPLNAPFSLYEKWITHKPARPLSPCQPDMIYVSLGKMRVPWGPIRVCRDPRGGRGIAMREGREKVDELPRPVSAGAW